MKNDPEQNGNASFYLLEALEQYFADGAQNFFLWEK